MLNAMPCRGIYVEWEGKRRQITRGINFSLDAII